MNGLCRVAGLIVLVAWLVAGVRWSNVLAQQAGDRKSEEAEKNEAARAEPNEEKPEGEVVEVPLDQIWAYRMPGTQLMTDALNPDKDPPPERELLLKIRRSLIPSLERKVAQQGFAVEGDGIDALRQAHQVLTAGAKPKETFPVGTPISLVFFSYTLGSYVHIQEVKKCDHEITIRYEFVPHDEREASEHFAIIPLGELQAGIYKVVMKQSPLANEYVEAGFPPVSAEVAKRFVCRSFTFVMEQQ